MTNPEAQGVSVVPELSAQVFALQKGSIYTLADVEGSGAFSSVVTELRLADDADSVTGLHVCTQVVLDLTVDTRELSNDVLYGMQQKFTKGYVVQVGSRLTPEAISFYDYDILGHSVLVVPELGGARWSVNSTLASIFARNEEAQRPKIAHFLQTHARILDVLLNSANESVFFEQDNTAVGDIVLSLPNVRLLEQEVVTQQLSDPFQGYKGIDDVLGKVKKFVRLAIADPSELREHGIDPQKAIMLHGPAGVGKTPIVEAIADAIGAKKVFVKFGNVAGRYISDWPKNLSDVFESAYAGDERVLLILDELDGLARTGNEEVTSNITTVLKAQLLAVADHPHVFVAITTNNKEDIDPDILVAKRVPVSIGMTLPSEESLQAILDWHLVGSQLKGITLDFDDGQTMFTLASRYDVAELAKVAEGLSGSDVQKAVQAVRADKFIAANDAGVVPKPPTQQEVLAALKAITER